MHFVYVIIGSRHIKLFCLNFALGNSATTDCQVKVTFLKKKSWTEKHTFVYVLLSVNRLADKLLSIIKELHLKKCFCSNSYFSVNNFKSKKYKYNKNLETLTQFIIAQHCVYIQSNYTKKKITTNWEGEIEFVLQLILNGDII